MINELKISRHDLALIQKELEANKPYEACGILIGTINKSIAQVDKVMPVSSARRSKMGFELDSKDFNNAWEYARKNGREIVGIYHTHPLAPAVPSFGDGKNMENFPMVWLIAGDDGVKAYIWDNGVKAVKITTSILQIYGGQKRI